MRINKNKKYILNIRTTIIPLVVVLLLFSFSSASPQYNLNPTEDIITNYYFTSAGNGSGNVSGAGVADKICKWDSTNTVTYFNNLTYTEDFNLLDIGSFNTGGKLTLPGLDIETDVSVGGSENIVFNSVGRIYFITDQFFDFNNEIRAPNICYSNGTNCNPFSVRLDEIQNPTSDKSFTMTSRQLRFLWTNPITSDGALELEVTGNFAGDVIHAHQHTGNPGAGTDIIHIEAEDTDVIGLNITTTSGKGAFINGNNVDKWLYNQTYSGSTFNSTYNTFAYNQTIQSKDGLSYIQNASKNNVIGVPGWYTGITGTLGTGAFSGNGALWAYPFAVSTTFTSDIVGFYVSSGTTATNNYTRIGLYANNASDNFYPTTLLWNSTQVISNTTNPFKNFSINYTFAPNNIYWWVFTFNFNAYSGSPNFRIANANHNPLLGYDISTGTIRYGINKTWTYNATTNLPSPFPTGATVYTSGGLPIVSMRAI